MAVQLKKKIKNQDTRYAYKNAFICIPYCGAFLISNLEKIAKLQDSNCEMHLSCSEQNPVCWRGSYVNDRLPQYKMR